MHLSVPDSTAVQLTETIYTVHVVLYNCMECTVQRSIIMECTCKVFVYGVRA